MKGAKKGNGREKLGARVKGNEREKEKEENISGYKMKRRESGNERV